MLRSLCLHCSSPAGWDQFSYGATNVDPMPEHFGLHIALASSAPDREKYHADQCASAQVRIRHVAAECACVIAQRICQAAAKHVPLYVEITVPKSIP